MKKKKSFLFSNCIENFKLEVNVNKEFRNLT